VAQTLHLPMDEAKKEVSNISEVPKTMFLADTMKRL